MRSRYAMAMGAAMISLVLTACGGGGGGGTDEPAATPSTALSSPLNTSTSPSHFGAVWRVPGPGAATESALTIIDTDTQRVVRTYDTYMWRASIRVQRMPGSRQQRSLGAGNVYMILNGQVLQLDLSGATLGQPKRISSITQACALYGPMLGVSKDGRHDWLRVLTAGPSGDCANRNETRAFLVASDMSETEIGPEMDGPSGLIPVSALPDAQGASTGLLVLEGATGGMSVYTSDMKTRRYTVADKVVTNTATLEWPIEAPDADQKAYLRAADKLYLLDWQSGKVVLGAPLSQLDAGNLMLNYTLDDSFLYFVRGGAIYQAASDRTVRLLAQVDTQLGVLFSLINTDNSICISQTADYVQESAWSSMHSIKTVSKSTGAIRTLMSNSADLLYPIAASNDEMVLLKYVFDGSGYKSDVLALNLTDGSARTLGADVMVAGALPSPTWSGSALTYPTLLWTEGITDQPYITYPARSLKAYSPGQSAPVILATLAADNTSMSEVNLVSWRSARPIIATSDINGDHNRFWMVQVDQANSLTPVLALP